MNKSSDFKIMVVDDEPDLSEAIAFDLKRKGFQVVTAVSGREAFEMAASNPVDLILSDVRMPNGDGIELLDRIKAKDVRIPVVIFISGFADITLEEAYEKGADAIFSKPFDRKALLAAIERALQPADTRYQRSNSRVETDLEVGMKFLESGFQAKCRAKNIARGGMFVELKEKFPKLERCEFFIDSDFPTKSKISGEGIIRWKREKAQNGAFPPGIGVEFLSFDQGSLKDMIEIINFLKTRSFIPRN